MNKAQELAKILGELNRLASYLHKKGDKYPAQTIDILTREIVKIGASK